MSDADKIEKNDFDKDSLLDFGKGPTELSSAKTSRFSKKPDEESVVDETVSNNLPELSDPLDNIDIQSPSSTIEIPKSKDYTQPESSLDNPELKIQSIEERIKELDRIIEESKEKKSGKTRKAESSEKIEEQVKFTPIEKAEESKPVVETVKPNVMESDKPQVEDAENQPLMPWEIDTFGRPLKDKTREKEKTSYEIWLDEKREKEGVKVKCPNCGAENIDLPFVTGEKCTECGFNLDADEDLTKKMESRDRRAGKGSKTRVSEFSTASLKNTLDLPEEIVRNL